MASALKALKESLHESQPFVFVIKTLDSSGEKLCNFCEMNRPSGNYIKKVAKEKKDSGQQWEKRY